MAGSYKLLSLDTSVDVIPAEPEGTWEYDWGPDCLQTVTLQHNRRWPGFVWSVVVHVVVISLMGYLPAGRPRPRNLWQHSRLVETLRLRVPETLYLASSGSPAKPKPVTPRKPAPGPKPSEGAKPLIAAAPRPSAGGRRPFQLPPVARRADTEQTLLQPRLEMDPAPPKSLRLPEIFFWNTAPRPPRVVKPFVDPGHTRAPQAPRVLDAPPRIDTAGAPPVPRVPANIQLANSARLLAPPPAAPIRAAAANEATSAGATDDAQSGDPVAVLSISTKPLPLRELLTIPPGNMIGRMPAEGSGGSGEASGQGGGSGKGAPGNGKGGREGGQGSGQAGTGPSAAGAGAAAGAGSGGSGGGGGGAAGSGTGGTAGAAREALEAAVAATRMTHPVNGVFDVVVQGGVEGFTESGGALSGRPIYTVYLRVGGPKDWILQYCAPPGGTPAPRAAGGVVRLDAAPPPISAPFPHVTMRPLVRKRPGTYMTVHGFIDADGKFQNLRVLGANDPQQSAYVISVLERWEFRPASRQQKPLRVEVLLAIPSE